MTAFEEYLALHEIDPVRLSVEAHVRYRTIYFAKKGQAISVEHAQKITDALQRVTGVPYTGSFVLQEQPSQTPNQPSTFPVKKLPPSRYP